MSTGDPPANTSGHPLNCQVGPATNTATTCFLYIHTHTYGSL